MSKAKSVVEKAIFDALDSGLEGATVYQDAPADAPYPIVILGDMKSIRLQTKGASPDRRVTINIVALVEAEERAPLLALQEQIEGLLDGQTLAPDGWTLGVEFDDDDAVLGDDGVTYSGISSFSVLALAD